MLAMLVSIVLSVLLLFSVPGWAAEGEVFPDLDINDPVALQEGSRVLEEELKLAARPQTYLLIDLVSGVIQIKARGVDLHRLPIAAWTVTELPRLTGTFRLTARPPVVRRKIDPSATTEQEPISLSDMPTEYRRFTRDDGMDSRDKPEGMETTSCLEAAPCGSSITGRSLDHQPDTLERASPVLSLVHRGWDACGHPSPLRAIANHLCQSTLRFGTLIPKIQQRAA